MCGANARGRKAPKSFWDITVPAITSGLQHCLKCEADMRCQTSTKGGKGEVVGFRGKTDPSPILHEEAKQHPRWERETTRIVLPTAWNTFLSDTTSTNARTQQPDRPLKRCARPEPTALSVWKCNTACRRSQRGGASAVSAEKRRQLWYEVTSVSPHHALTLGLSPASKRWTASPQPSPLTGRVAVSFSSVREVGMRADFPACGRRPA